MRALELAWRQVIYTNKSFWRNPASAFFTFAFPLMFLIIFTAIFGNGEITLGNGLTVSTATFYVPAIAAFSVITACYTNIAISLSFTRDTGVLKRTRGTPLPASAYLFGRVAHAVIIAILLVALCAAFGAIVYGARLPSTGLPAFLLTLVIGAAAFCALGIAVTAIIPNADAAPAVVNASILPLLFISNVFIPLENPPEWMNILAGIFPIRHFADALVGSWLAVNGSGVDMSDLVVVGIWGIVGLAVGIRYFTWEPRT